LYENNGGTNQFCMMTLGYGDEHGANLVAWKWPEMVSYKLTI
jgi:hypothetical protein